jgi:hypothetical protein
MLIYSVIYLLLAIYIERINPGEFGVSQSWNYLFKRSYWKSLATSNVRPLNGHDKPVNEKNVINFSNNWIELSSVMNLKNPSVTISHLTKVCEEMFNLNV